MSIISKESLKQYILLFLILFLVLVLGWQIVPYISGILGGVTLYILWRERFFHLTVVRGWKKWITALLFILISLVLFVIPVWACIQILLPRVQLLVTDPGAINHSLDFFTGKITKLVPQLKIDDAQIKGWAQSALSSLPVLLSATADMLVNLALAFFLFYFMLVDGRKMERRIQKFLPLKDENIDHIWESTRVMVFSNAIGIPVLAIFQGIVATLGYWLCGVPEFYVWGILTGVASILPAVGSALVWIPVCIWLFATGHTGQGLGLLIYSILVTSSVDNILRFTLLKKLGDVHPIITVLGVMVGIPLFGFMGLIFGPLLVSYLILLVDIYKVEFSKTV